MIRSDVLIIGAGPTGLVLALWLTKLGVNVRVLDKTAEPSTTSRALAVQARTLELYRQLNLTDAAVERGHKVPAVNLWVKGEPAARLPFERIGPDLTPYPFLRIFPQDQHERLLIARLEALGVSVERRTELATQMSCTGSRPSGERSVSGVVKVRLCIPTASRSAIAGKLRTSQPSCARQRQQIAFLATACKGAGAGIAPNIAAIAAELAKLDVVAVPLAAAFEDEDKLVLAAVERPHPGIVLDPHNEVFQLAIYVTAGGQQLFDEAPVHAEVVQRAVDTGCGKVPDSLAEKGGEFGPVHFARCHRKGGDGGSRRGRSHDRRSARYRAGL
jgi:FAD binding domain